MSLPDFINHVLNFAAPAAWLALLLPWIARFLIGKSPVALVLSAQVAINFIVCLAALGLGLWTFGHDGKMATYVGLVLAGASSQWLMLRGRRG